MLGHSTPVDLRHAIDQPSIASDDRHTVQKRQVVVDSLIRQPPRSEPRCVTSPRLPPRGLPRVPCGRLDEVRPRSSTSAISSTRSSENIREAIAGYWYRTTSEALAQDSDATERAAHRESPLLIRSDAPSGSCREAIRTIRRRQRGYQQVRTNRDSPITAAAQRGISSNSVACARCPPAARGAVQPRGSLIAHATAPAAAPHRTASTAVAANIGSHRPKSEPTSIHGFRLPGPANQGRHCDESDTS